MMFRKIIAAMTWLCLVCFAFLPIEKNDCFESFELPYHTKFFGCAFTLFLMILIVSTINERRQ